MASDRAMIWRVILASAGLVGAVGVASAAAASHAGESRNLGSIAMICLAHAPALLALGLAGQGRLLAIAAGVLGLGTLFFAADLGVREWLGHGLFAGAAPLGGIGMIGGWLLLCAAAFLRRK